MDRARPHIPLSIRALVLARQLLAAGINIFSVATRDEGESLRSLVERRRRLLFGDTPNDLHHRPPLRARTFNKRTGKYKPDANDPDCLFYLAKPDHHLETNVRGLHGQFPDRVLIKRERKRERKAKPLPKYHKIKRAYKTPAGRWPSHAWPLKGRKIVSRARCWR